MNLNFCVQFKLLQIHSCLLQNLVLEATNLHYFVLMEHIVGLLVDLSPNHVSTPLLIVVLETMAPFWTISDTLIDQTFTLAWEKSVVLDQT